MPSRTEANGTSKILHFLDLDEYGLGELSEQQKTLAKQEVADYLKNEVLRKLDAGTSPVQGEGRFRVLTSDYAIREKGGRRLSNLELEGDLKDDLVSVPAEDSFIKFGHEGEQVPKADGHNQLSGKAQSWARIKGFPRRRYIPDDNQGFSRDIESGIRSIIEDFIEVAPERRDIELRLPETDEAPTRPATTVNIDTRDLFSDDVIEDLLAEAFERRGAF